MIFYFIGLAYSAHYAILYAGSKYFYNYRHQADIFTIYNQLLARGFTTDNICLYAYDDIATDPENPFAGQIFHSLDHKINVYPGTESIHVKGKNVTAQAFYDAISQLPTTAEDYVFIESCYSGSVAEVLTAPNLAIITATNDQESSYAAVYDSKMGTYLSNEFTNYFISYIDQKPLTTIGELFQYLKKNTERSHASYYGDESMKSVSLSEFIGKPNKVFFNQIEKNTIETAKSSEATEKTLRFLSEHPKASIRARSKLELLRLKEQTEKFEAVLDMLVKYVDPMNYDKIMNDHQSKITPNYFKILRVFVERFGEINPDDLGKLNVLVSLAANYSTTKIIQGVFAVIV